MIKKKNIFIKKKTQRYVSAETHISKIDLDKN